MKTTILFLLALIWACPSQAGVGDRDFFEMIERGDIEGVRAALAEGRNIDAVDDFSGTTPLMRAVIEEQAEIVELLISAGADVNALSSNGLAPLERSVMFRRPGEGTKIPELLIGAGSDLEVRGDEHTGSTLLFYPAGTGDPLAAALLLKAGARSAADGKGLTPLHAATGFPYAIEIEGRNTGTFAERAERASPGADFAATLKILTEAGADIDAVCGELAEPNMPQGLRELLEPFSGKTPLDFARLLGNAEAAAFLESLGAKAASELKKERP